MGLVTGYGRCGRKNSCSGLWLRGLYKMKCRFTNIRTPRRLAIPLTLSLGIQLSFKKKIHMGDFSYLSIFIEGFMWLTIPFTKASCSPHHTHPPTLHLLCVGYLWHSCFSSWDPHAALSQHKTNKSSPPSRLHLISSSTKWIIEEKASSSMRTHK